MFDRPLVGQLARILPRRVVATKLPNKGREKARTGRKKDLFRPLTEEERGWLERISRSQSEPASHVIRGKELLAVAEGRSYTEAAQRIGRKCGDPVSYLVEQFNRD